MQHLLQRVKLFFTNKELVDENTQLRDANKDLLGKLESFKHYDTTFKLFGLPSTNLKAWTEDDENSLCSYFNTEHGRRFLRQIFTLVDQSQKNAIINGGAENNRYAFAALFILSYILRLSKLSLTEIHWETDDDSVNLVPKFAVNSPDPSVNGSTDDNGALFGRFRNDIWKQ